MPTPRGPGRQGTKVGIINIQASSFGRASCLSICLGSTLVRRFFRLLRVARDPEHSEEHKHTPMPAETTHFFSCPTLHKKIEGKKNSQFLLRDPSILTTKSSRK
jgi:hypothetical protein